MKANDLRIGNYVSISDGYHKDDVREIYSKELVACYNGFKYFGIPLTPEILEKCGFKKRRDGEYLYSIDLDKHISIVMSKYTFFPMLLQDAEFSGGELSVFCCNEIQYLHQLQNLIHALTGEELTVNI